MIQSIPYSTASTKELFRLFNIHAERLGQPKMKKALSSRVEMAQALAMLMTKRNVTCTAPPPKPPKMQTKSLNKEFIIEALCDIAYYTSGGDRVELADAARHSKRRLVSVGFPYDELIKRLRVVLPKAKLSIAQLRVHKTRIATKEIGYEHGQLPDIRPRSGNRI